MPEHKGDQISVAGLKELRVTPVDSSANAASAAEIHNFESGGRQRRDVNPVEVLKTQ
jgi:hypothetical protein